MLQDLTIQSISEKELFLLYSYLDTLMDTMSQEDASFWNDLLSIIDPEYLNEDIDE